MITVFIPAYNAHEYIEYAIMSLASQTIRDFMKVVIIDDGSEQGYKNVIDKFSRYIKIEEVTQPVNMGVGAARQKALDILDTKYFAFLDADDIYIDSTVFEFFYNQMESNPDYIAIFGQVYEETKPYSYILQDHTDAWVFGKIYRSSYIKKNNLFFPPTRGNEDSVFNISLGGCLDDNEMVVNYEKPIYLWRYAAKSLTRKNNFEFFFNQDLKGLVNGIYYIKDNPNISKKHLRMHTTLAFFHLYFRYHDNKKYRKDEFSEDMIVMAKKIYNDFLKDDTEWLEDEKIIFYFNMISLDFHKPYENISMFKDFVEKVK